MSQDLACPQAGVLAVLNADLTVDDRGAISIRSLNETRRATRKIMNHFGLAFCDPRRIQNVQIRSHALFQNAPVP